MKKFDREISKCTKCPRLIKHCAKVAKEKRKSYMDWTYWGRPVPNFGDDKAEILIVGLAPAAHGANRTGRMFTGDRSGDWLYRALYKAGFANQSESYAADDGLTLSKVLITAVCHCAPPLNKPTNEEIANCTPFLDKTIAQLPLKGFLALGGIGWNATLKYAKQRGWYEGAKPKFSHGAKYTFNNGLFLVGSYHPSQQNTFTKRLTEPMFDQIFRDLNKLIKGKRRR